MNPRTIVSRRRALGLLGAAGAALTGACGGDTPTSPSSTSTSTTSTTTTGTTSGTAGACAVAPSETVGPYPSLSQFVRSDIREDRPGLPLNLTITVVNASSACAPVAGASVEIWQCDVAGAYSQYGNQTTRTFLRGIQTTNSAGEVVFTTIYPGWYQGRATHIHVEVARAGQSLKVTQIAFPEDISNQVHTQGVYASRGVNSTTNARDGIFADGFSTQLASVGGSPASGMTATFRLGVNG
jgi:protocatechuate 3,4-dioxygenase beta subunit